MHSNAQRKNSDVSSDRGTRIIEDFVELCQVGIEQVQGMHRGQNSWMFHEKVLFQVDIETL
jgi:hypothetical protein